MKPLTRNDTKIISRHSLISGVAVLTARVFVILV